MDCGIDHKRESQETGFDISLNLRVQVVGGLREESVTEVLIASPCFFVA